MALETGNRIEDLVDTNPTGGDDVNQGDDHLRLIKACVQGSFPSLGSTQVSATASDLNKLTSGNIDNEFVRSFNSRTGSVTPATSDYDADQIDYDNTTSGLTATDVQAAIDELAAPVTEEYAAYDGDSCTSGNVNSVYFNVVSTNSISDLGTIVNTNSNGWQFTVAAGKTVKLDLWCSGRITSGSLDLAFVTAGTLSASVTANTYPNILLIGRGSTIADVGGSAILTAGQSVQIHTSNTNINQLGTSYQSCAVRMVATEI